MGGKRKKVEVMYFYSSLYEDKESLLLMVRKLRKERKDVKIRLIDIEDPENVKLTEIYNVNSVPLVIFLSPNGIVASRKNISLSEESIINSIVDRVIRGDLPKPHVDEIRRIIIDSLRSIPRRNELTELIVDQIEGDILEADSEDEIFEAVNLHISLINHTIRDLEELKRALQIYAKREQSFII